MFSGKRPLRVVLLGDSSVGKTSIVARLFADQFNPSETITICANWHLHVEEVEGERVELQIWDTAGQECYRSIGPLYYRLAVAGIIFYDVTNPTSFANVRLWANAFRDAADSRASIFLVGNKTDIASQRLIKFDEGHQFASENAYVFFETSAKTGDGIHELFQEVAEQVTGLNVQDDVNIGKALEKRTKKCC
jgi:small GTP-binding protein